MWMRFLMVTPVYCSCGAASSASLLPLWRKVACTKCATDEGSLSTNATAEFAETHPSPGLHLAMQSGLSHKGRGEDKSRYVPSATIGLRSTPIFEISTSQTSPGFIQSGGSRREPTPPQVPETMTSPGVSGRMVEMYSISAGM